MDIIERAARALCEASWDGHKQDELYYKASENPCPQIPLQEDEMDEMIDGDHLLRLKWWRMYVPKPAANLPVATMGADTLKIHTTSN